MENELLKIIVDWGRGGLVHRRTRPDVHGESGVYSGTCIRSTVGAYMWNSGDM